MFKMIAVNAQVAMLEPKIYCVNTGNDSNNPCGKIFNPIARITQILMIYVSLEPMLICLNILIPAFAMIPLVNKKIPPTAAEGITAIKEDNLLENPMMINRIPT